MAETLPVLLLGVLIGMKHALESDHVAAVASLATRASSVRHVVGLGIAWGCGHTVTLLLLGTTILMLDAAVPESMARALEVAVGVMLILLGADVIRRVVKNRVHIHPHRHGEMFHVHAHSHGHGDHRSLRHDHDHSSGLRLRALMVGIVHGMAGSAALVLLAAQTINDFWMGLLYILLFGLGSIVGMAVLSAAISLPLRLTARHFAWADRGLAAGVGVLTIVVGAYVLFETWLAAGLLT